MSTPGTADTNTLPADTSLRVDVDAVLRSRMRGVYRYIPRLLINRLASTICQDELNDILDHTRGLRGAEFCTAVLKKLDVSYTVEGTLPDPSRRDVIIVSNHPLGALDGIAMIEWASVHYGSEVKFIVNDLLMAIRPLDGVFLPVNKHGRQSRHGISAIDTAMADKDTPVVIFPAGLCSRRTPEGAIADLRWQKTFVNKAVQYGRDIIPVYFSGQNSPFFYNFAKLRQRVGLKFNIEMIYLPREIFRSRGKSFTIKVGPVIPCHRLKGGPKAAMETAAIRKIVYSMGDDSAGLNQPEATTSSLLTNTDEWKKE